MKVILYLCCFFSSISICFSQQETPLYSGEIPNSKDISDKERIEYNRELGKVTYAVSKPTLSVFLPLEEKTTGLAVVICPGGGYVSQLSNREGADVAKKFNDLGVAAFVLKYRLPDDEAMTNRYIVPLQDAQQALRLVRQNAKAWNINPDKVGIMGFSAGGHLAATAGTHFDSCYVDNPEKTNIRPDFMILINPVISFTDEIGHIWSRKALLNTFETPDLIRFFSNELNVNAQTPPAFLVHNETDSVVAVENSTTFYETLRKYKVSVEMHIYSNGEHGFITAPPFYEWFGRCIYWLKSTGWLEEFYDKRN